MFTFLPFLLIVTLGTAIVISASLNCGSYASSDYYKHLWLHIHINISLNSACLIRHLHIDVDAALHWYCMVSSIRISHENSNVKGAEIFSPEVLISEEGFWKSPEFLQSSEKILHKNQQIFLWISWNFLEKSSNISEGTVRFLYKNHKIFL